MYDAKNEPNEFVGETTEEAVTKACRFFVKDEGDLNIINPAEGEVFGLGGRVVIVAVPKDRVPPPKGGGSDRDDRPRRGRDRGDRGDRGGRGRDRDRGDRGDRGERGGRGRGSRASEEREEREAAPERKPKADSKATYRGEVGPAGQFLGGLIERMGLGPVEVTESSEENFVIYRLSGEAAVELGTGDGRAVDAVQLLANQAAMRDDEDHPRVVVDCEGDAERREDFLTRLAKRAAKRAQETGRSVALDPMNARDRRLLHVGVRELDGVASMSIGSGRYRQVVVVPEGAAEYDEAIESSKAAEDRG